MSKRSSKDKSSEITKYQKYEKATISRSEIKNAPYNPRRISDKARKKLKDKIAKVGLINAPVWNRRTGNLVGGHQRLEVIDSLERGQNYQITVDAIDVDEKTEKEMNVFLNNTSAMGEWNLESLDAMLKDSLVDMGELGFDDIDLQYLLQDGIFSEENDKAGTEEGPKLKEIKAARKKLREENQKKDDEGFYAVIVFRDREQLEKFVEGCDYPAEERYLDGSKIAELLGISLQ